MVVGLFPVLGLSTLLCTILALVFRLNLPAMQAANYGVYPLQLMLMLPFARLGEKVFHARAIPFSPLKLSSMLQQDMFRTLHDLGQAALHAMAGWALVAPLLMLCVYSTAHPMFRALAKKFQAEPLKAKTASAAL